MPLDIRFGRLCVVLCAAFAAAGCSTDTKPSASPDGGTVTEGDSSVVTTGDSGPVVACNPDESAPVPADRCAPVDGGEGTTPGCNEWVKVELPGKVCGDGSPYKFFVNYSNKSNNLVIDFEPGGACWDYDSCSGKTGIRGAANPHGILDDHMSTYKYLNLLQRTDQNPAADYNMVFVPYCTGDIHSGNKVATYTNAGDGGSDSLVFHHAGHENTLAVIDWVKTHFTHVPKMLVTGCSAGGAGAIINYYFIRSGLGAAVQCGYLLDDSGPIFHSDGPSKQLHAKTRSAWNVDSVLDTLDGKIPVKISDLKNDFGLLNVAVSKEFPRDRLSITLYREDLNYSLYSYQRFFPGSTEADIHAFWWTDVQGLIKTYDGLPNMAYYIPYFREDNCSHCVSIPPLDHLQYVTSNPWFGSEIPADKLSLKDFTTTLLDDQKPLKSYLEDVQSTETFTSDQSAMCMAGG
jgi:hypothetical protein